MILVNKGRSFTLFLYCFSISFTLSKEGSDITSFLVFPSQNYSPKFSYFLQAKMNLFFKFLKKKYINFKLIVIFVKLQCCMLIHQTQ